MPGEEFEPEDQATERYWLERQAVPARRRNEAEFENECGPCGRIGTGMSEAPGGFARLTRSAAGSWHWMCADCRAGRRVVAVVVDTPRKKPPVRRGRKGTFGQEVLL